jgi:hypothetical protein
VIASLLLPLALAGPAEDFSAANTALGGGDLPAARDAYLALLASGASDGDVYYNLGNVLYREKRVPLAILAWRRAEARLPRDPDVAANLDFARRGVADRLDVSRARPAFAPWQLALTADEGQWLGWAGTGLGLALVAARRLSARVPLLGVGLVTLALGLVVLAGGIAQARIPPAAVVLVDEVKAQSDLGGGVELFTLHAGAEVDVSERSAGKALLRLPDGRRGWVDEAAVGLADPDAPFPVL